MIEMMIEAIIPNTPSQMSSVLAKWSLPRHLLVPLIACQP